MRPATTHRRATNWPDLLAALAQARQAVPFAYGVNDCGTFAADAALAIAGPGADFMAPWRGRYATEAEMLALRGGATLEAWAEQAMAAAGLPPCPLPFAQRGDVLLLRVGNEDLLGVLMGRHILAPGLDRQRSAPIGAALRAWAV